MFNVGGTKKVESTASNKKVISKLLNSINY